MLYKVAGSIKRSLQLNDVTIIYYALKKQAKELLLSEEGIAQRKRRCWEIEAVFADIKQNMNFRRFMLRGLDKVTVETGLLVIAHNLKKFSAPPKWAI